MATSGGERDHRRAWTHDTYKFSYFPGGRREQCRMKAIASFVERLLRYANCSGPAGST